MVRGRLIRPGRPAITFGVAHPQRDIALQRRGSGRGRTGQQPQQCRERECQHHRMDDPSMVWQQSAKPSTVHGMR